MTQALSPLTSIEGGRFKSRSMSLEYPEISRYFLCVFHESSGVDSPFGD